MKNDFYIVDVFADEKYSGNPLAVVILNNELSQETMQKVATEMNFSETSFVHPKPFSNGQFQMRIFTPSKELDFAGHPILGTADVIRKHLLSEQEEVVHLKLNKSDIAVIFEEVDDDEIVWFKAPSISLGETIDHKIIATALGIEGSDLDTNLPIQKASAGTSAVIVPLRNLDALQRSKLNLEKYAPLLERGFPPLTYLFTTVTRNPKNDFSVRFFFDAHGVREDPATGNGAAFFGQYLLQHGCYSIDSVLRIEQGYEVDRPSLVLLHVQNINGSYVVKVGGRVIPVVNGSLL